MELFSTSEKCEKQERLVWLSNHVLLSNPWFNKKTRVLACWICWIWILGTHWGYVVESSDIYLCFDTSYPCYFQMYKTRVKEIVAILVASKKEVKDFLDGLPKFK